MNESTANTLTTIALSALIAAVVVLVLLAIDREGQRNSERAERLEALTGPCEEAIYRNVGSGPTDTATCHPLANLIYDGFGTVRCVCP